MAERGITEERRERARELESRRDYPALVRELEGVERDDLLAEPGLGYALAVALRATGHADQALALVQALREPTDRSGFERLQRQLLNLESALRFQHGDVTAARDLWQQVLALALRDGDHDLAAKASNNLGVIHTLQARSADAIAAFARAEAACQRTGDRRGLAQAHQNLAINYREDGHHDTAHAHFRDAMGHARSVGSDDVLGRAEEERAVLFLLEGDAAMAEASAHRALQRLTGIGDVTGRGESRRVLGLVALATDQLDEADRHLHDALGDARNTGAALLEAETLEALAFVRRRQGDPHAASASHGEAAEIFRRLGAEAWGERLRRRIHEHTPS